ncbi:HlyD family type I secretion periplasmic adaptor subunit [Sulfurospirillum sp. UCH001]|uniref:HlyD family type I secretion periplasmic adaptor subunit n=1 Tax=Sulfurospirillum sp. UCH001 TaxID=1581011 RepID=UPI00082CF03C|nr:HlyD family type I secretion periplasmic adaptor subunit [Sulfurospirillum sp. UCH001]
MISKMMIEKRWNYYVTVAPIALFFLVFLIWSALSEIDEVVRGNGKIVPSGQTKVLQHLEGGIVSEILVKEGDHVMVNQPIYQLNQAFFTADIRGKDLDRVSLQAKEQRLVSLIENKELVFDKAFVDEYPQIAHNEMQIFQSERQNSTERLSGVSQKVEQRSYELKELEIRQKNLALELNMAVENTTIAEQLMKSGAGSRKEYLLEMSKKQNLITQVDEVKNQVPVVQGKYQEAIHELGSTRSDIQSKLLNELKDVRVKLSQLSQQSEASIDRANRLLITSPVNGIVNVLYFHTVGGTIKAGDKVAEITPIEEGLMIEANIKASDRGRIWVGQKANIEITAYDYARYGMIEGELVSISPDSFTTQKGEIFYAIKVKASKDRLGPNLPIMPGMEAGVNIITGKRTVLGYILLPLKRMGKNALLEP